MARKSGIWLILVILLSCFGAVDSSAQANQRTRVAAAKSCELNGVYRINVPDSDKLYTAVEGATGKVPFREQQRFFMDLSVRLTPPDILAIECRGNRVTVGSSRAAQVTFLADGKMRSERAATGGFVRSRISLEPDKLTFTSNGKAADNVNVEFALVERGERLLVTRHIYAEQLAEPIVINTFYDKIADAARWDIYGESPAEIARQTVEPNSRPTQVAEQSSIAKSAPRVARSSNVEISDAATLRESLARWIDATNANNIAAQMRFYLPVLKAFYLARNAPSKAVRLEKERVFAGARSINIRAAEPEIVFQDNGQTAIMRFRKDYAVENRSKTRSGAVVQELRWQQTTDGWKISSERDVRVIR